MMASRGMGDINPSKMPGKKEITRTDDPNKVAMYKRGGRVKKMSGGGKSLAEKANEQIAEYQNNKSDDSTESSFMPSINGGGAGDEYGVGMGGRASLRKRLNENTTVGAYLEGGAYKPKEGKAQGKMTGAGLTLEHRFVKGGEVWDKPNPKKKHKKLSPEKKVRAKAAAKAAGRPYPNLIDNMRMAK